MNAHTSAPDVGRDVSRARITGLRAALLGVLLIGLFGLGPILIFPFISWMSEASFVRTLDFPEEDLHHLVHGVAIGLVYGTLLVSLAVQLLRPQRWVAPLWVATFLVGAQVLYDLVNLSIGDPVWFVVYGLMAAIVLLHPRRTAPLGTIDRRLAVLVGAGAIPLAAFAIQQLGRQFGPEDGFGHAAGNHYYGMAALATIIIVGAVLGTTELPGARLSGSIAGVTTVLFAVASLAHSGQESAWPRPWALTAAVWALACLGLLWRRPATRTAAPGEVPAAETGG